MTDTGFLSSLFIEAMAYSLISYVALGVPKQALTKDSVLWPKNKKMPSTVFLTAMTPRAPSQWLRFTPGWSNTKRQSDMMHHFQGGNPYPGNRWLSFLA